MSDEEQYERHLLVRRSENLRRNSPVMGWQLDEAIAGLRKEIWEKLAEHVMKARLESATVEDFAKNLEDQIWQEFPA